MIELRNTCRLLVRQAGPADLEQVQTITQAAYAEQRALIGESAGVFRETPADLSERLASGWVFLLAELESRPVGAVRLSRHDGELYIGRLAVLPSRRGAGIGSALMTAAEAWGRAWGLPAARLGAREDVLQTRPYYESLGYCVVERAELRRAPGRYFFVMRKDLAQPAEQPTPVEITGRTYERYAQRYARRKVSRWDDLALAFWREVLPAPALVAAVGCGPGHELRRLQERGYSVVGLDRSAAMLRLAAGAPLARGDLRSLPFADSALDGVWAVASLLHLPRLEIAIALAETRRCLRPGGALLLSLKMGGGEAWRPTEDGPRFFAYYQPDEVRRLLCGAGFTPARQWVTEPLVGLSDVWLTTIGQAIE